MSLKKRLKVRKTLSFRLMVIYAIMYIFSSLVAFSVFYIFITSYLYNKNNEDMKSDVIEFQILYEEESIEEIEELKNYCPADCDDSDCDGVCDEDDICEGSLDGEPVDQDGCDIFQFCSQFSCGLDCFFKMEEYE